MGEQPRHNEDPHDSSFAQGQVEAGVTGGAPAAAPGDSDTVSAPAPSAAEAVAAAAAVPPPPPAAPQPPQQVQPPVPPVPPQQVQPPVPPQQTATLPGAAWPAGPAAAGSGVAVTDPAAVAAPFSNPAAVAGENTTAATASPRAAAPRAAAWAPLLTRGVLLGALAHVGVVIAAACAGGLILLLVFVLLGASGTAGTAGAPLDPAPMIGELLDGVGVILSALFTLSAAVLGGELNLHFAGGAGLLSAAGGGAVLAFPLTLTLGVVVVSAWWGARQGRRRPLSSRLHRAAYGLTVGAVSGVVLLLIALMFAVRIDEPVVQVELTAAGYRVVLFSTLLVGLAAWLGREAGALTSPAEMWTAGMSRLLHAAPRAVREWAAWVALGAVLFGIIGAGYLVVTGWDDTGAGIIGVALIAMLNLAALVAAIAHLGGVDVGGRIAGAGGDSMTLTVPGGDEPAAWLTVLAALLLAVFVALWNGTRRPRSGGIDWAVAWRLPVLVTLSWLVFAPLFFSAGMSAGGGAGIFGGTLQVGIGVALWTAPVMFLWAALAELGTQTLPGLMYAVFPRAHRALAGRRSLAQWVAGAQAPGAQAPGAPAFPTPASGAAGAAVAPAPTGAVEPQTVPAPQPLSPRAKRGLIIGACVVGGVLFLAIAGGVVIGVINSTRSPEAVAEQYLEHIAAGRAEAANDLVDPNVSTADRELLTDEVLGSASERITDISVESTESQREDVSLLEVSYRLDGVTQRTQLEARKGEPEWLLLDTWELTSSLASETTIWINGPHTVMIGDVPIVSDGRELSVVLYPGIYELSAAESAYYALKNSRLVVQPELSMYTEFEFEPTDKLHDEVAAQVDALLAECVTSTDASPEGCPFNAFTFNDDTQVTWTLKDEPALEIGHDGTRVEVSGVALGSYSEEFFGTVREREEEDRFRMTGEIAVDGDELVVEFDDSWW